MPGMATLPRTYPYGYTTPTLMLTKTQINAKAKVAMIDPEMMRRVWGLMDMAADAGVKLGIGGAGRLEGEQDALFRRRHTASETDWPPCQSGSQAYMNKCWTLNPGAAAAALPGRSYHEITTPQSKALALDMIGDMAWMGKNLKRFGMYTFSSEPWHIQPVEVPAARLNYNSTSHVLKVFPLPQPAQPIPPQPEPPPPATLPFTPDIVKAGTTGESTYLLQTILRYCAAQALIVPNGVCDNATVVGIKNLQSFFGLVVDGVCGLKETWPHAFMIAKTTPVEDPS